MELFLEKVTRESEAKIRSAKMQEMLNKPFEVKLNNSNSKVNEFVDILGLENVVVSTSGGKDSACLSRLCKDLYPNIKHIMFNTGLEYKATIDLAKKQGAVIIPPSTTWWKSCEKHGYPIVSKNISRRLKDIERKTKIGTLNALLNSTYGITDKWIYLTDKKLVPIHFSEYCCTEFKKKPSKQLKLNPIVGTRIQESDLRKSAWKKSGCNSYSLDYKHGESRPMSLWLDDDVEKYIEENDVELSELYTQYEQKRTGCFLCPYGSQYDGSRFDLLKKLQPDTYKFYMTKTKLRRILIFMGTRIESDPEYMSEMEEFQNKVEEWRKDKEDNKYLQYRLSIILGMFSKEEVLTVYRNLKLNNLRCKSQSKIDQFFIMLSLRSHKP